METSELKLNSIIEVVGFLDRRTLQGDNEELDEHSSLVKETYCIHTVQFKLFPNLVTDNEEMRKLKFVCFLIVSKLRNYRY